MRLGTPFEALHEAMAAAAHRDMSEITYEDRDWEAWRALSKDGAFFTQLFRDLESHLNLIF
jgi:hypothetical protein